MKEWIACLFLFGGVIARAQLVEVNLPVIPKRAPLVTLEWPDSTTGYLFTQDGRYYKTVDAGKTWTVDSIGKRIVNPFQVTNADFISPSYGVVMLRNVQQKYDKDSIVYITKDGGKTWSSKVIGSNNEIWGYWYGFNRLRILREDSWLLFHSRPLGGIGQSLDVISHTSDEGRSWVDIHVDTVGEGPLDYFIVDSVRQYKFYSSICVDYGTLITRNQWTKDGGESWSLIPSDSALYGGPGNRLHLVNDTGISLVWWIFHMPGTPPPPIYSACSVSKDNRWISNRETWESLSILFRRIYFNDVVYADGILYACGFEDTRDPLFVWDTSKPKSTVREFAVPTILQSLFVSKRTQLWAIGDTNRRLYSFDFTLVPVESLPVAGGSPVVLSVNPHPVQSGHTQCITLEATIPSRFVNLTMQLHDISGRRLVELPLGDHNGGEFRRDIPISALQFIPGVYMLSLNHEGKQVTTARMVVR